MNEKVTKNQENEAFIHVCVGYTLFRSSSPWKIFQNYTILFLEGHTMPWKSYLTNIKIK